MADDSFIVLGTALPQIKKTDAFGDPKKPNPTRDQEVRDEQGRRRFHGAFTGGFSAGYFNTVGSKEGWTPSEFVSSRNKRAEQKALRPEDFMDEEDKQLAAESSRLVAKEDFDTLGSTQRELEKKRAAARNMQATGGVLGALPDNIIDDLVVPSSEPVGIRLLKRMGWKPGQGIGPRVTKRVRKQQQNAGDEDILDVDLPADMTFAPIDSAIVVFTNKANHFGLGYDPYKDAPEFDRSLHEKSDSKYLSESTGGARKIGFGFGSLDDDDEDDDIYGSGPGPTLSLSSIEQHDVPSSRSNRSGKQHHTESRSGSKRPKEEDLVPRYCHDGHPPLRGYILAGKDCQTAVKWFDPPKVPRDFVPRHVFRQEELERRPYPGVHVGPPRRGDQQQPKLTAEDRSLILGETPIEGPRRSVFEYISAENKSRLDNILGFVMDTEGEKHMRKDRWEIPRLEPASALAALQGYIPFGDNLAKQNRYKLYLNVQAGLVPEGEKAIEKVEGFTGEDMNKELNEFVQAARIFKPLTASMANRFTSASKTVEFTKPAAPGLQTAAEIQQAAKDSNRPFGAVERMEVPKSQAAKAAAMGMFGPLTRSTVDFYPVKLLCKRFHVADPHPDHKDQSKGDNVKDLLDKRTMETMMVSRRQDEGMDEASEKAAAAAAKKETEEKEEMERKKQEEEDQKREEELQVVPERPPMDIFKAIFDDSDSDSDSDDNNDDDEGNRPSTAPKPDEVSKTTESNTVTGAETEEQSELSGKPFRPMFSIPTKSERSTTTKSGLGRAPRAVKLDLDDDAEVEEDEDSMGPKLLIPKPKTVGTKRSISRRKEEEDDVEETGRGDNPSAERINNDEDDDDVMVGPMPPPSRDEGDKYDSDARSKRHKSSKEAESSPSAESSRRVRDGSFSGSDSEDDGPSRPRSRQRSISSNGGSGHGTKRSYRSRTRSKSPLVSSTEKEEKESRSHNRGESHGRSHRESSHKKSRKDDRDRDRDRDHAREKKDRNRDRDREKDRDWDSRGGKSRSSEKHRSSSSRHDRHRESRDKDRDRDRSSRHLDKDRRSKDKKSSRRDQEDRDANYPKDGDDDEDLWVEKEVDTLPLAASKPPSSNRPRASAFF